MLIVSYFKPKPVFLCSGEVPQHVPPVGVCARRVHVSKALAVHAVPCGLRCVRSCGLCTGRVWVQCVRRVCVCVRVTALQNDISNVNVPRSVQNIEQVLTCVLKF